MLDTEDIYAPIPGDKETKNMRTRICPPIGIHQKYLTKRFGFFRMVQPARPLVLHPLMQPLPCHHHIRSMQRKVVFSLDPPHYAAPRVVCTRRSASWSQCSRRAPINSSALPKPSGRTLN